MPKKTLTNQANNSANRIASQDLATEMVELLDEALSQVYGGIETREAPCKRPICIIFDPDSLRPGISPYDCEPSLVSAFRHPFSD